MPAGVGHVDANGIWLFGEGDASAPFSDTLNLGQQSVSDQFTADRSRLSTLEASALVAGAKIIKPTVATPTGAGSGAAILTLGTVTFAAATDLVLRNCFPAGYTGFLMRLRATGASGAIGVQLATAAGAPEVAANYDNELTYAAGPGTTSVSQPGLTSWTIDAAAGVDHHVTAEWDSPGLAAKTFMRSEATSVGAVGSQVTTKNGAYHRLATAYPSLALHFAAAMAGEVTIYGLSRG